jgi:hypothetical protein
MAVRYVRLWGGETMGAPADMIQSSMATGAYILISLALLYAGVHLLVVVFSKVKDTLFKMFLGAISIFMIVSAVAVFFIAIHHLQMP